jgi:hypothetical protein
VLRPPEIITTYIEGSLLSRGEGKAGGRLHDDLAGLEPEEVADLTLLQARLSMTLNDKRAESAARLN